MSKQRVVRRIGVAILSFLCALASLHSQSFSVEAGFGAGSWGGTWISERRESYRLLGLSGETLLSPTASAGLCWAGPRLFGPVELRVATGLGLWSGGIGGRREGNLEQSGSVFALTLESIPRLEADFPLGRGALRTFLGLGAGFVVSPIVTIDMLPGLSSVSTRPPEFLDRLMGIASLGIGYRTRGSFSLLLRLDGSLSRSSVGSDPGTLALGRLLLAADYPIAGKESRR